MLMVSLDRASKLEPIGHCWATGQEKDLCVFRPHCRVSWIVWAGLGLKALQGVAKSILHYYYKGGNPVA